MEEHQVPPSASSASLAPAVTDKSLSGLTWPPPGWPMFACVTQPSGMTFRTGVRGAEAYLKYEVSADANGIYQLEILNGRGATITPVIGMRFAAREDWSDDESGKSVIDIHIRGQRLIPERGCILRVILAMTFIISRIDRGIAPSLHRVFRTYRLS